MNKVIWSDWITHIPGQELLPGTYVLMEVMQRDGSTHAQEGMVNDACKGHGCWHVKDPYGPYVMITRYKIQIDADVAKDESKRRLTERS